MGGSSVAIRAVALAKRYRSTQALRGLDLEASAGSVLCLIGPNGAGKTTAVRILATLVSPDSGRAEVAGYDVVRRPREVRARIGLTGQYAALDELLSGRENLELIGRLSHLRAAEARRRALELLECVDLIEVADRPVRGYSGGMRRRLDLAASIVPRPSVVFLDEPTTGLDPRSRAAIWQLVRELVRAGTTVLLTTQYLEEADRLADRVAVIDRGRVIARGRTAELKRQVGGQRLELAVDDELNVAARILARHGQGPVRVEPERGWLAVAVRERAGLLAAIGRELDAAGVRFDELALRRPTLDDVFLAMTASDRGEANAA
jgi:ABC-2 type transport system ATP-binding protein